jgi:hypothetical protein
MSDTPNREIVEKTDSAEISQNAKGDVSFKVKAYADDVDVAVDKAHAALVRLKARLTGGEVPGKRPD